jgi:nicotinate phosphoribosyltransferase
MNKCFDIDRYCHTRIQARFGIGTNLTNDVGADPSNIVMKLTRCQITPSQPIQNCVKLSDVSGKNMGDPAEVMVCKLSLNID